MVWLTTRSNNQLESEKITSKAGCYYILSLTLIFDSVRNFISITNFKVKPIKS